MADFIHCPRCQRKLRLDESVIGKEVQCPSCQNAFTAELPTPVAPPYRPRPLDEDNDPPVYRQVDDPPLRPRYDSPPRPRYDDDEDFPRRPPRYSRNLGGKKPHRGSTIQTLGILSLVLCFCQQFPALIMAIIAIVLAVSDLSAMNRGDMDESGRGQTKTGLTCAIIALVCLPIMVLTCLGFVILNEK